MPIDLKEYDPGDFYDEMMSSKNRARPLAKELITLPPMSRSRRWASPSPSIREEGGAIDRTWPFDIIPRIITQSEWDASRPVWQRVQALNLFIDDLYHEQKIIKDGVFPAEVLAKSELPARSASGIDPPLGIWAHICGSDLVRDGDGTLYVLEDNLRVPSGVSYMLENRSSPSACFPSCSSTTRRCRSTTIHPSCSTRWRPVAASQATIPRSSC
jgi:uncharacterized circularly permuted ATP-grasp superfamily protein